MGQPIEQIVRRKLSDEVFDRLKRMITSGELQPGDEMPSERELMERFGVGRPAIREAMQSLASMGLVSISHGERAKVLQLTAQSIFRQVDLTAKIMLSQSSDSLEHLKSARIFFERGMAREAAPQADAERYRRSARNYRAAAQIARRMPKTSSPPIWSFTRGSLRFPATRSIVAVSEAMLAWLKEYHTEMLIWTGKEKFTLVEHEEIIGTAFRPRCRRRGSSGAEAPGAVESPLQQIESDRVSARISLFGSRILTCRTCS